MAGYRHIVGWVGEDHFGLLPTEQPLEGLALQGIAADEPVPAELPEIARPRHDHCLIELGQAVLGRIAWLDWLLPLDQAVDLGNRKPDGPDIEIDIYGERLQLLGQQFFIPAGIEGKLVV